MGMTRRGRGRILVTAVAGAALAAGSTTIATTSAQSAAPGPDCTPFPVAEVAKGQAVTGLTVSEGTVPDGFTGEVLGVLENGIAPGLDMIMAELTNPAIDQHGIWQGMSGSPVYAQDGRLIGAVAYGLSYGESPVAGITPYEHMDDYLSGAQPTVRVKVDRRTARAIAERTDVTREEASQGFRRLPMPMSASGISTIKRDLTRKQRKYLVKAAPGAAGSGEVAADAIVPGGNLAATVSYGDLTLAGVGTITSVCNGEVVGFGHPMLFSGKSSMGLSPADAIYVHSDNVSPGFKVANIGAPVGTITDDRLSGISGDLGATPDATTVDTSVAFGTRDNALHSDALLERWNADVVFSQALANHDTVFDAIGEGSATVTYSATGTDAAGQPFAVTFADRYQSDWDISFEAIWDSADVTYLLSRMSGVDTAQVTLDSVVAEDSATWRLRGVEARRGGEWVKATRRNPIRATAGKTLRLRVTLAGPEGTTRETLALKVPRRALGRQGYLRVVGGASLWNDDLWSATTPAALAKALDGATRNDQVAAMLELFKRRSSISKEAVSESQTRVVRGSRFVEVRVR